MAKGKSSTGGAKLIFGKRKKVKLKRNLDLKSKSQNATVVKVDKPKGQ